MKLLNVTFTLEKASVEKMLDSDIEFLIDEVLYPPLDRVLGAAKDRFPGLLIHWND